MHHPREIPRDSPRRALADLAEEDGLVLIHSRVGEQQRGVVVRHHRRRRVPRVAVLVGKEVNESRANLPRWVRVTVASPVQHARSTDGKLRICGRLSRPRTIERWLGAAGSPGHSDCFAFRFAFTLAAGHSSGEKPLLPAITEVSRRSGRGRRLDAAPRRRWVGRSAAPPIKNMEDATRRM